MRDPAEIYTKRGTPAILIASRIAFAIYFAFTIWAYAVDRFPESHIELPWIFYQAVLYLVAELFYSMFRRKGVDLTFGWPLVFAVFMLSFATVLFGGQEQQPLVNRAEHFASFVLLGYIVWIFFLKYLPHNVWHDHPYYTALLTLAVTSLLGVGNELFELVLDRIFHTELIGSRFDTPLDLLMNTLGTGMFLSVRLIIGSVERD